MVAKETKKEIRQHLDQLKVSLNVDIIFAVEMGSSAWGFYSDNSDYDIRFIYRNPMSHYLTYNVETKKDIIELQNADKDWDIVGWDIRKVCKLFAKSNGNLIEWLRNYEKGFENYFPHQTIHDKQQRVEALEKIFRDVILS